MFGQIFLAPVGVILTLRIRSLWIGALTGVGGLFYLYVLQDAVGTVGFGIISASTATLVYICILAGLTLAILLLCIVAWNVEANFTEYPWRREQRQQQTAAIDASPTGTVSSLGKERCPFTGKRPVVQCTVCKALVSEDAWHAGDKYASFDMGGSPLDYRKAMLAEERSDADSFMAAAELDEALAFQGNYLLNAVSPCCVGCEALYKTWNLMPRLALTCTFLAMCIALVPFAFAQYMGSYVPLRIVLGILAAFYGGCGIMVALRMPAATYVFMAKFAHFIDWPHALPLTAWQSAVVYHLAGASLRRPLPPSRRASS